MAERRLLHGWTDDELAARLAHVAQAGLNFREAPERMNAAHGWHEISSSAVVSREAPGAPLPGGPFERACELATDWRFSDPRIVRASWDAEAPLVGRTMLLELRPPALRYLCAVRVGALRSESEGPRTVFGIRVDTLEGHIERGSEWFLVEKDHDTGEVRATLRAAWQPGDFPGLWSAIGFRYIGRRRQRAWHRLAHERMHRMLASPPPLRPALLRHEGPPLPGPSLWSVSGPVERARRVLSVVVEESEKKPPPPEDAPRPAWRALALGAVAGIRSAAPIALAGKLVAPGLHAKALAALAAGEALADKLPFLPPRTDPIPLFGRALSGTLSAALLSGGGRAAQLRAGALAAAAALGSAHAIVRLRRFAVQRLGLSNAAAGLIEDVLVAAATALLGRAPAPKRPAAAIVGS